MLGYSAMAKSPDGKGVLLFGGFNPDYDDDRILELQAVTDSWIIHNITLHDGRRDHTVIPIP